MSLHKPLQIPFLGQFVSDMLGHPPNPEYEAVNSCHPSHVNFETKKTPIREFRKSTGSGDQPASKRPRTGFIRNATADKAQRKASYAIPCYS